MKIYVGNLASRTAELDVLHAFEKFGLNIDAAAQKQFEPDEILPWQHLGGPDKKYLFTLLDNAMKIVKTEN